MSGEGPDLGKGLEEDGAAPDTREAHAVEQRRQSRRFRLPDSRSGECNLKRECIFQTLDIQQRREPRRLRLPNTRNFVGEFVHFASMCSNMCGDLGSYVCGNLCSNMCGNEAQLCGNFLWIWGGSGHSAGPHSPAALSAAPLPPVE